MHKSKQYFIMFWILLHVNSVTAQQEFNTLENRLIADSNSNFKDVNFDIDHFLKRNNESQLYANSSLSLKQFVSQDTIADPLSNIMDIGDVAKHMFRKYLKKKELKNKKNHKEKKDKKLSLLILPDIAYNPVSGVELGLSGSGAGKFKGEETNLSMAAAKIAVTSEKQILTFLRASIYTNDNEYYINTNWRYYKYNSSTFGLGTNSPENGFDNHVGFQGAPLDSLSGGYPMDYNFVIIHQVVNKKIRENLYVGVGYHLDKYWGIKDLSLNLDTSPAQITPHFKYSVKHGFNPTKYTLSGLSVNTMYDSRDNQISPYKGYFARLNYQYSPVFLGSSKASSQLWAEFRTYVGLSKKKPRTVLAFWVFGKFQTSGTMPYLTLMSIANDENSRSGRGYIAGRYRGENMVYSEIEYRFPILKKQTLGGVVFLNAVTASNNDNGENLFDYVRPAAGFGIRVLVNKHTRLNINLDMGFGFKSKGFYFAAAEAF